MDVSDYDGRTPLHLAAAEVKYQQSAYYMEKMNTYLRGTRSASRFSCTSVMSTPNPQTGNKLSCISWTIRLMMSSLMLRWGFTPLSEAERGGHKHVETILKLWTARFVALKYFFFLRIPN